MPSWDHLHCDEVLSVIASVHLRLADDGDEGVHDVPDVGRPLRARAREAGPVGLEGLVDDAEDYVRALGEGLRVTVAQSVECTQHYASCWLACHNNLKHS